MRSLSSTLLEAQKSPSRVPFVKVEVLDRVGGVARLRFQRHDTGSEPEHFHTATMPSDGSLIRARVDPPAGYKLYIQRTPNPTPNSDFSAWSLVTSVSNSADTALCSEGSTVLLFYVAPNQQTIYVKESNNNGQSFGSPVIVATAPSAVTWMAAGLKAGGTAALFYVRAGSLYVVKRTGGNWGTPQAWSNTLSSLIGVAAHYDQDWNVMVAGVDSSSNPGVWTTVYGDGSAQPSGTWSGLEVLTIAESGSDVTFKTPFMTQPDVHRATFVELYNGANSYSRPFWSYIAPTGTFIDNLWREPVPFQLTSSHGVAMASDSSGVWLSTPDGVWSAALDPAPLEVGPDALNIRESVSPKGGEAGIELRNDDGIYLGLGSGTLELVQKGSEVRISPGYRTSAGEEVSAGPTYWIEGWEYRRGEGGSILMLYLRDWWGILARWRARRQFAWGAGDKSVAQLLAFVMARAGLAFSAVGPSDTMSNHSPSFTIHPGETAALAVRRLLAMVPDVIIYSGFTCTSINPSAADASVYSYGTDHPALEAGYAEAAPDFNRVQVFGDGTFGEDFDWPDMPLIYDRLK
ncbi:MAG: hypothetical protein V3U26_01585, partial [Dehalococcoidia bacterium]